MDFRPSDEQQLFRRTMRDFVDAEIRPVAREWEREGRYPTEIVDMMKQMGLFGLTVPEEYGGMDADIVSMAIVFEEISRAWMGIAGILGSHSLSCAMIAMHGTSKQKQRARGLRRMPRVRPRRGPARERGSGLASCWR